MIFCESGDWVVLKLNGEIYEEGHSIPDFLWLKLFKELGLELTENQEKQPKACLANEMQDKFFVGGIRWVRFHLFYGSTTMGN